MKDNSDLIHDQLMYAQTHKLTTEKKPKPKILEVIYKNGELISSTPSILKQLEMRFFEQIKEEREEETEEKIQEKLKIAVFKQINHKEIETADIKRAQAQEEVEA